MRCVRSRLTEDDRAEWAHYARHVRALPGRDRPPPLPLDTPPAVPGPTLSPGAGEAAAARPIAAPVSIGFQPPGVDNATWRKFRAGKLPATRTLDLHGQTSQRAFGALRHFLHAARAEQVRCVEVITGRGSGEGGGVLRRELPLWLALPEISPLILAAAHPHAANPGAVRLLLRRLR